MSLRLIVAALFFSISAQASHLDTVCKSALTNEPIFSNNFLARKNLDNIHVIEDFDGTVIYSSSDKILGIADVSDKIWVLTSSELIALGQNGEVLSSYPSSMNKSMTLAGDRLMIVRSGGVISAFDLQKNEMAWTSYMQDIKSGLAVTIAYDGKNAYVAMATAHQNGFTGIAVMDPATGNIISKTPYDSRRVGVIGTSATARWYDDKLILNNLGWIHVITSKQLQSSKPMRPRWVAHRINPEEDPHYMMLQGDFMMENGHVVGCGRYRDFINGEYHYKSGLFRVKIP